MVPGTVGFFFIRFSSTEELKMIIGETPHLVLGLFPIDNFSYYGATLPKVWTKCRHNEEACKSLDSGRKVSWREAMMCLSTSKYKAKRSNICQLIDTLSKNKKSLSNSNYNLAQWQGCANAD
ncbi:hypothetical protein BYT27DRAFT_7287945 [Phlegmacium glaucopus]|nr:hypothetical protein BYT27DRAFT_7296802 [Phlegmacium glaucopus]KAF8807156.1 hypothetical protein BYT27DRAFT_7287945 [Phlegmacium glaucopus]